MKGPLRNGLVSFYTLKNGHKDKLIASATTDNEGFYSLPISNPPNEPVLVEASGGSFTDESSSVAVALSTALLAYTPNMTENNTLHLTPLTHIAAKIISESQTAPDADSIKNANQLVASFYSVPNILSTTPMSLTTDSEKKLSSSTAVEGHYGLLLAGFSELASQNNKPDPLEIVELLADDASDRSFDGKKSGRALTLNGQELNSDFGTSTFASAIESFSVSDKNSATITANADWKTNLQSSSGDMSTEGLSLYIDTYPELYSGNSIEISGYTVPGLVELRLIKNGIREKTVFSGTNGRFSLNTGLNRNEINTFRIEAVSTTKQTYRQINIREHSIAPLLLTTPDFPDYINVNSLSFSYLLSSSYGHPLSMQTVSSSQGLTVSTHTINNSVTGIISLTGITEGAHSLNIRIADSLGNERHYDQDFFADFTAPVFRSTIPTLTCTNLFIALNINENSGEALAETAYRLYNSTPPAEWTTIINNGLYLDFNLQNSVWTVDLRASDRSGNTTNITRYITFDNIAPSFISTAFRNQPIVTNSLSFQTDFSLNDPEATISFNFQDPQGQNFLFSNISSPFSTNFSFYSTRTWKGEGNWTITPCLKDPAGNSNCTTPVISLVDISRPAAPSVLPLQSSTGADILTLTVFQNDSAPLLHYIIDNINQPSINLSTVTTALELVMNSSSGLQNRSFAMEFQLEDAASNHSDWTTVLITHDSQPPAILSSTFSATKAFSSGSTTYLTAGSELLCSFVTTKAESGASLVLNLLGTDHSLIATDDNSRFETSISFSSISTEISAPLSFSLSLKDSVNNTAMLEGELANYAIDTIAPRLESHSFNAPGTWVGIGKSIILSFSVSEEIQTTVQHRTVPLSITTTDNQNFSTVYTVTATDASPVNPFGLDLLMTDPAGNQSTQSLISTHYTDPSSPVIVSISNDRQGLSWLKIGDSINFTVSPKNVEPYLSINATYNSTPVSFTLVSDQNYYIGRYTVAEGAPPFTGTTPQLYNLEIYDQAGNNAIFDGANSFTEIMAEVGARIDSIKPVINNIQLNYIKLGSETLIIDDRIEFRLEPAISLYAGIPTTPLTVIASFSSEVLNFTTSSDGQFFVATHTINRNSVDTTAKSTKPALEARIVSLSGNSSSVFTTNSLYHIDTGITLPTALYVSSVNDKEALTVGDDIKLEFIFNQNNNISSITGLVYSTPVTFISQSSTLFSTTLSIPYWGIETDKVILHDFFFSENSGNISTPQSYSINTMYFTTLPIIRNFFIDTKANSISSISYSTNPTTMEPKSWLKIGDSVTFSIYPLVPETGMKLLLSYNDRSLDFTTNSDGSAYYATYTVNSGDNSAKTTPLQISDASFVDSSGLSGPLTSTNDIRFFIDASAPETESITCAIIRTSCLMPLGNCDESFLKSGDIINFYLTPLLSSLHPDTDSTNDIAIISSVYNTIPLSFNSTGIDHSYASTLIISSVVTLYDSTATLAMPVANSSTPQISIILSDLTSNVGSTFISTNLTNFIDAEAPQIDTPTINAESGSYGLSSLLRFTVPIKSNPETDLTILGLFNEQELNFLATDSGSSYVADYSPLTTHPTSIIGSFSVTAFDRAGNFTTSAISGLNLHIVTSAPELISVSAVVNSPSPTYAGINSTIIFSVEASAGSTIGTNAINHLSGSYNGRSLTFWPVTTPYWRAQYTVSENDDPGGGQKLEDIYIRARNTAGNYSSPLTTVSVSHFIDATRPVIESINITARREDGTLLSSGDSLRVSDTITFSVQSAASTTDSTYAKGYFNTKHLEFQLIEASSPRTYIGTYTFAHDDPEVLNSASYKKFDSVYLIDQAGNEGSRINTTVPYLLVKPSLSHITHSAVTTSRIGLCPRTDNCTVEFSLHFQNPWPDLSVSSYFNTTATTNLLPLVFSATDSTFATWSATYTFMETHDDDTDNTPPQLYGGFYPGSGSSTTITFSTTDTAFSTYPVASFMDKTPPTTPVSLLSWFETSSSSDDFLKIGDHIFFSVEFSDIATVGGLDPTLSVTGVFNSRTMTFTTTTSGKTYLTSYTVIENDNPAAGARVDFGNIIALDLVNNPSLPFTISVSRTIDATKPIIDSVTWLTLATACTAPGGNCDQNYLKIGDQIEFSVNLNPASTDVFLIETTWFNDFELSFTKSSDTLWIATYTVSEGDNGGTTPVDISSVIAADTAGNRSSSALTSVTPIMDTTRPEIQIITHFAFSDLIGLNDIIEFSLYPTASSTDTRYVSAEFNSVNLLFSLTDSANNFLSATYTALDTHNEWRNSAGPFPQMTARLIDIAGNVSPQFVTTDMEYLIDTGVPQITDFSHNATAIGTLGFCHSENTTNCSITFSVEFSEPDTNLIISAAYNVFSTPPNNPVTLDFQTDATGSIYIATYSVSELHESTALPLQLGILVTDSFGNASTSSTADILKTIDTVKPEIDSVEWMVIRTTCDAPDAACDADYLKIGDQLEFSVNLNAASTDVTAITTVLFNDIALNFNQSTTTLWIATYTISENDNGGTTPIDTGDIIVIDLAGNPSLAATTSVTNTIDATRPVIFSLEVKEHPARSVLGVDDDMIFELQAITGGVFEENGSISSGYNDITTLDWAESTPGIYSSTYTVLETHTPQTSPLDLTGLLFYDQAGNVSDAASATVTVSIDTSYPATPTVSPMFLTTDTATYNFTITGEAECEIFLNSFSIGTLPAGAGDTSLTHEVSLDADKVTTFVFQLVRTSQNASGYTTARLYRTDNVTLAVLNSAIGSVLTTNIDIRSIQQSIHNTRRLFIISRAGISEINELSASPHTSLNKGLEKGEIFTLAEKPDDENLLWLGMENGLFKSVDRGRTWTEMANATFGNKDVLSIALSADELGTYNVWVGTDQGSFFSANGGSSFSSFQSQAPDEAKTDNYDIHVYDGKVYTGTGAGLYRTDLAGSVEWNPALTTENSIRLIAAPSYASTTMFIATTNGLLRSDDFTAGPPASFTNKRPTTEELQVKGISAAETEGLVYLATTTGVFESDDFGDSWQTADLGATISTESGLSLGTEWTTQTVVAGLDEDWTAICQGDGIFVAVNETGTGDRAMYSNDGGITWTAGASAADNNWTGVTYGNSLFVAVANTGVGNRVMTSADGAAWISQVSATDNDWTAVTYGNSLFVAVANTGVGDRVMTSVDGAAWTSQVSAADNNWTAVTYGNGLFVAVANSGVDRVMTSPDGVNWTSQTPSDDNNWTAVSYGNGLFVAVSDSLAGTIDDQVMTSPDGINWTARTAAANNDWASVTYGNGLFVAMANSGTDRVMTSPNGINWTTRTPAADNDWTAVAYGDNSFVAVSATAGVANRVMSSNNLAGNFTAVTALKERAGKVYLGDDKHLWYVEDTSSDIWASITRRSNWLPPKVHWISVPESSATSYFAASDMWVFRNDEPDSWVRISANPPTANINFAEIKPGTDTIYFGTDKGLISRKFDGTNEQPYTINGSDSRHISTLAFNPDNSDIILAGTVDDGLYKYEGNWTSAANADIGAQTITDISFNPDNGAEIWAATDNDIWYSSDTGTNWTSQPACTHDNITQLISTSSTDLYFVTTGELFYSDDGCLTAATSLTDDFDPFINHSLVMTLSTTTLIYLASDEGVWKTTDGGANFIEIPGNIRRNANFLAIREEDDLSHKILVGTDAGIYWFEDIKNE